MKRKVAIIGAGLQAGRRAPAVQEHPSYEIALVVDRIKDRAQRLAKSYGAEVDTDWRAAIHHDGIDSVLVLTYPDSGTRKSPSLASRRASTFSVRSRSRTPWKRARG